MNSHINQIVCDILRAATFDSVVLVTDQTVKKYCKLFNVSRETLQAMAYAACARIERDQPRHCQIAARACGALATLAKYED